MLEARKCARCGCMYISDNEVCGKCQTKDGADLHRLKGFFENQEDVEITKGELAIATGISNKNLSRFLGYEDFKGFNIDKKSFVAAGGELQSQNGIPETL